MKNVGLLSLVLLMVCCTPETTVSLVEDRSPVSDSLKALASLGGSGEDRIMDMVVDPAGTLYLAGYSDSRDGDLDHKPYEGNDYWLLMLDDDGELIRSLSYGGSMDDRGQALALNPGGGIALAGYAMSSDGDATNNEGFHDNWILELDMDGGVLWEQSFGFAGHDHAYDLLATSDGGYFIAGFLDVTASGGEGGKNPKSLTAHGVGEFWVNRLNSRGEVQWRSYFGGSNNDRAHAICHAPDGGAVMAGFTESDDFDISTSQGSYDFWLLKVDANGELVWENTFGGSGIDIAHDVEPVSGGGYLVVGQSISKDGDRSDSNGGSDAWVVCLDEQGELIWERSYGGAGFDLVYDIAPAGDKYLLCGTSRSAEGSSESSAFWAFEIDKHGTLEWEAYHSGPGINEFRAAALLPDGRKVFAGSSKIGEGADAVLYEYDKGVKFRQ